LVSSWAPVQWRRRARRAHGHNGVVVRVALPRHQHFTGFGSERGLTLPSRGRPQSGFACLRPPLMSNVRALGAGAITLSRSSRSARAWSANCSWLTVKVHRRVLSPMRLPAQDPFNAVQASSKMQGPRGLRKFRFLVKPNRKVLGTEVQPQCTRTLCCLSPHQALNLVSGPPSRTGRVKRQAWVLSAGSSWRSQPAP